MLNNLKEKYPDVRFEIIRRTFSVANYSLQQALNENETIDDYDCSGYREHGRIGFVFMWRTSQGRYIFNRVDFKQEYLPYPELIKMIADNYKPSYEENLQNVP